MQGRQEFCNSLFRILSRAATAALALAVVFALTVAAAPAAQAQTFTVIHSFNGVPDGYDPLAGLTIDAAGNLYGTTYFGDFGCGTGCGTVFKLTPKGSGWFLTTRYSFQGGNDGANPAAGVIFGPDGSIYGTTVTGGSSGVGVVFNLKPPASACVTVLCPWTETTPFTFTINSGWDANGIVFDPAGNIYGTTSQAGLYDDGVVYELTPSNGSWTEAILHAFSGEVPYAGVIFDQSGNLYGTAYVPDSGIVYELTVSSREWQVLHTFTGSDGYAPFGGLIFDNAGNLYGTTFAGGANGDGTVFELSPSNGSWILNTLYSFTGAGGNCNGYVGSSSLAMDAAGNLYGTTPCAGAYGYGSVFKLTPSNGGWTYTSLHDFCAGGGACSDGARPWSNVVFDSKGNLYGTASEGGSTNCSGGCGVVWEITP